MKKKFFGYIICTLCLVFHSLALDIDISVQADNFGYRDNGTISSKAPDIGFEANLSAALTGVVGASFSLQRIPNIGNLLKPRVLVGTKTILFSFGPSISILNKGYKEKEFSYAFQPGLGVGMRILTDKGFLARFDIDFSIYTGLSTKNIYINNGEFEIGMRMPHVFGSLKLSQLSRTTTINGGNTCSITDASINFEVFSKPSRFVFPLSFICRFTKYKSETNASRNANILSLVLSVGLTHNIYHDIGYYIQAAFPVYTIALSGIEPKPFRYDVKAGVRFSIN